MVEVRNVYEHEPTGCFDSSKLALLIVSFILPIITLFFLSSFFLSVFFILLSGKTVIITVPTCCIMVSGLPVEQWIKLYLQLLWSLDEGGRCLCGVIITTQWSCCQQPCHLQLKRHDCVLVALFSCPTAATHPPTHPPNQPCRPNPSRFVLNRSNFLRAMKSRNGS